MREVIESLVRVEAKAQRVVESAREEAERLVAEAEQRAREVLTRGLGEARAEAADYIETAIESARQEKARRLQAAAAEIGSQARMDDALQDQLVQAAIRCICGRT